ncbi:MAG: hypothetical protein U9Q27_03500 [Patescibacteria group bacterium]|nr:hypothetical protein [Patescibacteria group bacterium]
MTRFEIFNNQNGILLTGRLLGLIKEEDLFPLLNNKTFQRKIFSKATLSISKIAKAINERDRSINVRLIAVVKKFSNNIIPQRILFVSDKLDFAEELPNSEQVTITGQNDSLIFLEKK